MALGAYRFKELLYPHAATTIMISKGVCAIILRNLAIIWTVDEEGCANHEDVDDQHILSEHTMRRQMLHNVNIKQTITFLHIKRFGFNQVGTCDVNCSRVTIAVEKKAERRCESE